MKIPNTKSQITNKPQTPNHKRFGILNFGHWNLFEIWKLPASPIESEAGEIGNSQSAFTLIEAVVSVSIFAIAMTSIVGVFVSVQRLNSESISLQFLQQNGRFIIEDLTKMIRNGQIDYGSYLGGVPQPSTDTLRIINQNSENVSIFKLGDDLIIDRSGIGSSALTGTEVKVLDFKVYIWPATNPFPGGTEQPTVTVFIDLESNINPRDTVRIPFQTTVSTRQYPE